MIADRVRLRPYPQPDELAIMYAKPHRHDNFPDHIPRVQQTIDLGKRLRDNGGLTDTPLLLADLSCGDATIINGIRQPADDVIRGDFALGYSLVGPIRQTIRRVGFLDMFVCCETIEHLDDPDDVLDAVREMTDMLLLSTPIDNWDDDNPEHIWSWSKDGVDSMLDSAGFETVIFEELDMRPQGYPYCWGFWGCR